MYVYTYICIDIYVYIFIKVYTFFLINSIVPRTAQCQFQYVESLILKQPYNLRDHRHLVCALRYPRELRVTAQKTYTFLRLSGIE